MTAKHVRRVVTTLGLLNLWWIATTASAQDAARPVLRVVYFVPSDRRREPNCAERLARVLTEVQRFYREGMKQNGDGPMTFASDSNPDGSLRIHLVKGKEPMRAYDRDSEAKVRKEVKQALAKAGLDLDQETVLIFQVLLEWQGNKAMEIGPFIGGGNVDKGSALVFDDAKLDPRLLPTKQPGGYFHRPCTLGEFNAALHWRLGT